MSILCLWVEQSDEESSVQYSTRRELVENIGASGMDESVALLGITYHRLSNLGERRFNILVGSGSKRESRDPCDVDVILYVVSDA